MIRINLMPLAERQPKWPVNRLMIAAWFVIIIIVSGIYAYNVFTVWSIEKQLQDTRNQYQLLQPTQAAMTKANNKQQLIDRKNNILTVLTKEHQSWYAIIQHLTLVTSPQVFFTDMIKSDKGMIQIKGWTTTYPLVAEFMHTMENDQLFIEPALMNVEKDTTTQATKFEVLVKPRGL